jgi:polysaccharide biosynthesis transport protein
MRVSEETRARRQTAPPSGGHIRAAIEGAPIDGRGYLALLARRKWIIVPLIILVPVAAYILAARGTPVYEASAQVYLNRQSQNLSGVEDVLVAQPERLIRTQADIARIPVIAQRVVEEAGLRGDAQAFLGQSSVGSSEEVDLLTFSVRDERPGRATALADLYAQEYIEFRRELDTKALRDATQALQNQLNSLEGKGLLVNSGLYSALTQRLQQLQSAQVLQESNALLVREAGDATQVEPRPMQSAAFGLGLAVFLGLGLAFLIDALDTRVREPEELADALGLPLLGSLPEPTRSLRSNGRIVMLDEPNSADAEPYRMLRTSLEVTALRGGCRSLMVTSALAQEGKSTTAANLAIAFARTGRHVVLVDLDLRRPSLDRFFALRGQPGISDLVFGRSSLGDAGTRLTFGDAFGPALAGDLRLLRQDARDGRGNEREPGILDVIGSGTLPPNPGEFMVKSELDEILAQVQERVDLIIIDGPPLLLAGEALTLSSKVDAMMVVSRMNVFRRGQISELERILAAAPTVKLGLVATSHTAMSRRSYYSAASWAAADEEGDLPERAPRARRASGSGDQENRAPEIVESEPGQSTVAGRRWT